MSIQQTIESRLTEALEPQHIEVINESHMHNVPPDSETHFKVIAVSAEFEGQSLVNRHRIINRLLADQLQGGVHALSLHTLTESEWSERNHAGQVVPDSPACAGGDGGAVIKAAAENQAKKN